MCEKQVNLRFWLLVLSIIGLLFVLDLPTRATALSQFFQAEVTPTPTPLFGEVPITETAVDLVSGLGNFSETLLTVGPVMLLAAVLGGMIAYRRRLTVFQQDLFQAHILLSVSGALMMLIVGNELVRAFGLLGAASVVRYRYKLRNPRDASMLIIALGVGMASGAGLYALAVSAATVVAVFSVGLDFLTNHTNPFIRVVRPTALSIRTTQPEVVLKRVNKLFEQHKLQSRLQSYRLLDNQPVNGQAVYQLTYTLMLAADDSRFNFTAQLGHPSIVGLKWGTDKSKK